MKISPKTTKYWGLGFQLIFSTALLGILGNYIDEWLQIKFPIFIILGITLGMVFGIKKLLIELDKKDES